MIHLALHFAVPLAVTCGFFKRADWQRIYLILIATMLVDLDHLLADPIYDPTRCSIDFHPLHGFIPIGCYGLMTLYPPTRIAAIGLLIHMGLDLGDCVGMGIIP